MIRMNDPAAMSHAIKLAEILCATQGNGIQIDKIGADELADFIEILENRFTGKEIHQD